MIEAAKLGGNPALDSAGDTRGPNSFPTWPRIDAEEFWNQLVASHQPAILRGQVAHWPLVRAATAGADELVEYILGFDAGSQVELFVGELGMEGRFFYNDDLSGFNFSRAQGKLDRLITRLAKPDAGSPLPPIYMGSTPVRQVLPGLEKENSLSLVEGKSTEPRLWIGSQSTVAPHFDETDNVACVAAGRRRFILFPPGQVENLYVGPLDFTMAGQPASMVDFRIPDLERYPRFKEALQHALIAELGPGDAIYIPALWWHGVEALSDVNILINYWWTDAAADAGSPFACLTHGVLTISELPSHTREAWRAMFDHFVFQGSGPPADHLPAGRRGIMEQQTTQLRSRIRRYLLTVLGGR